MHAYEFENVISYDSVSGGYGSPIPDTSTIYVQQYICVSINCTEKKFNHYRIVMFEVSNNIMII